MIDRITKWERNLAWLPASRNHQWIIRSNYIQGTFGNDVISSYPSVTSIRRSFLFFTDINKYLFVDLCPRRQDENCNFLVVGGRKRFVDGGLSSEWFPLPRSRCRSIISNMVATPGTESSRKSQAQWAMSAVSEIITILRLHRLVRSLSHCTFPFPSRSSFSLHCPHRCVINDGELWREQCQRCDLAIRGRERDAEQERERGKRKRKRWQIIDFFKWVPNVHLLFHCFHELEQVQTMKKIKLLYLHRSFVCPLHFCTELHTYV